ncbi:hypothetical protein NFF93_18845, partial [Proteus mirabilis]|nr:hypothetical protein [Proteus mirabilis]MDF7480887.1 hypothetical protein [Proteus mirabilis]
MLLSDLDYGLAIVTLSVTLRRVPMAVWHEAERTGTTARVEYQDTLTFTYDKVGQLVREASARGDYQHHY